MGLPKPRIQIKNEIPEITNYLKAKEDYVFTNVYDVSKEINDLFTNFIDSAKGFISKLVDIIKNVVNTLAGLFKDIEELFETITGFITRLLSLDFSMFGLSMDNKRALQGIIDGICNHQFPLTGTAVNKYAYTSVALLLECKGLNNLIGLFKSALGKGLDKKALADTVTLLVNRNDTKDPIGLLNSLVEEYPNADGTTGVDDELIQIVKENNANNLVRAAISNARRQSLVKYNSQPLPASNLTRNTTTNATTDTNLLARTTTSKLLNSIWRLANKLTDKELDELNRKLYNILYSSLGKGDIVADDITSDIIGLLKDKVVLLPGYTFDNLKQAIKGIVKTNLVSTIIKQEPIPKVDGIDYDYYKPVGNRFNKTKEYMIKLNNTITTLTGKVDNSLFLDNPYLHYLMLPVVANDDVDIDNLDNNANNLNNYQINYLTTLIPETSGINIPIPNVLKGIADDYSVCKVNR